MQLKLQSMTIRVHIQSILLFLYLTIPFFCKVLNILSFRSISTEVWTNCLCILLILLYVFLCVTKKYMLVGEFWILYLATVIFFIISVFLNPENKYWFLREDYGMINYVLRPDNGIFIYLFLRLLNNPKKILTITKTAGWLMYLYYGRQIIGAMAQGYWIDHSNRGYEIHLSYNLSLGYNILLYVLAFLFCALEEKKVTDWVGAAIGVGMTLVAGSRGPFLDVAIFLILYFILKIVKSRKKIFVISGIAVFGLTAYILYPVLLIQITNVLDRFNISSRFLQMLSKGIITEDSGRFAIWKAAMQMIKENPMGYGAFGTRPVIGKYIYVGHPHQIFLEILVDFGVFIGGAFIIWLIYNCIKLFIMDGADDWKGVYIVFLGRACQLLLSVTFWHSIGLWGVIAIGVCMYHTKKKATRKQKSDNVALIHKEGI